MFEVEQECNDSGQQHFVCFTGTRRERRGGDRRWAVGGGRAGDVKPVSPTAPSELLYRRLLPPIHGLLSHSGDTHPAVTAWESRLGLVGFLVLGSASPRSDRTAKKKKKHFSVKEQKQRRMDRGGRSNGDSASDLNPED